MRIVASVASILMIIGALNWGMVGLFNFDVVEKLFGRKDSICSRIVYTLIGLAGLFTILYLIF